MFKTIEQPKNYLELIRQFNLLYDNMEKGENDLSDEENKQLELINFILFDRHDSRRLVNPHICNGGTCTHGKCSRIGEVVSCDTGCTYLGA